MRTLIFALFGSLLAMTCLADIASLKNEANIAAAASEYQVAAGKLQQVLKLTPDDGAAHYQLATLLMDHDGDLYTAEQHFKRAGELNFQPQGVAYRLARIYSRNGREADAFEQLKIMADGGFALPNLLQDSADFDSIREHPEFIAALDTVKAARYPCKSDPRHHAFDFWIGEWNVTAAGQFAGTNSITPILGHCTLFEQWTSASGSLGKSFSYFDPGRDRWRQVWISDTQSIIEFTGEARDGGIFYTAETINPADGSVTLHKFEFTQIDDGIVRQYWETSTDDGNSWQPIWDGRYERKTADP